MAAPLGRILWSVQAGLVLAVAGAGMLFIRRHLLEEVSQMLLVIGTLAVRSELDSRWQPSPLICCLTGWVCSIGAHPGRTRAPDAQKRRT